MTINTLNLAKDVVKAPLGVPTLPVELDVSESDVNAALVKYYSYVPIKKIVEHSFGPERELTQPINTLLPNTDDYFYVGVFGFATRMQVGQTRLNEYLLGTTYMWPNGEPEKQMMYNTLLDWTTGDPYYEEDFVNNQIKWVVGGSCRLSVTYGLGHHDATKLPHRHVDLFAGLIGLRYYERLIAIRETGDFGASDFKLSTVLLNKTLDETKVRVEEQLNSIGIFPATLG